MDIPSSPFPRFLPISLFLFISFSKLANGMPRIGFDGEEGVDGRNPQFPTKLQYPPQYQPPTQLQYPSHHNYWPSPFDDWLPQSQTQIAPSPNAFVQQQEENRPAWSVSYSEPKAQENRNRNIDDHPFRPFHRYISQQARFARPPDPQMVWHQKLNSDENRKLVTEQLWGKQPEIPQAIRNYFSLDAPPEKVVKEFTGVDLHKMFGQKFDQFFADGTTAAPSWTRATTPKDKLVEYVEKSLDNFLGGRFRAMGRVPYLSEKLEKVESVEKPIESNNTTMSDVKKQKDEENDVLEGSGEEPSPLSDISDEAKPSMGSSISGIPKQMPFIPKVPQDFAARQEDPPAEFVSKIIEMNTRRAGEGAKKGKEGGEMDKSALEGAPKRDAVIEESGVAREAGMVAKTVMDQFQYGAKPSYQQGVLGSILNFLGINSPQTEIELDQALTDWVMEHSPKYSTRHEKRAYGEESSYSRLQKFLSAPLTPLCTVQPETMNNFDVNAFMGQWFEVMYSPLVSPSTCSVSFYRLLGSSPGGAGSVFQTLQYSSPKRNPSVPTEEPRFPWDEQTATTAQSDPAQPPPSPILTSGYAFVSRPGQIVFKRSKSAEEVIVHIIDAEFGDVPSSSPSSSFSSISRYEYAILGLNCNYPLFVIARDPYTFKQKYEKRVMETLKRKGLVNDVSRLLNIVTAINPEHCLVPSHFFNAQSDQTNWGKGN